MRSMEVSSKEWLVLVNVYHFMFNDGFNVVVDGNEESARAVVKEWFIELLQSDFFTNEDFILHSHYSLDDQEVSAR